VSKLFSKLFLSIAFAAALPASATQVSLSPVVLEAPVGARAQALSVKNPGKAPVRFQVEVLAWTQVDGKDGTAPTRAVMASPRIVEIPAGGTRAINVARLSGSGPAYFRLVLRQLPTADQPKGTMAFLTHHNLSVAFEDPTRVLPALEVKSAPGGYLFTNRGQRSARLSAVGPEGAKPWREGPIGWVLPGQSKFVEAPASVASLSVRVNGQTISLPVQ
jgi:fimbrial chaperone protein